MIQIEKMVSSKPLNCYAPTWDVSFGVTTWEDEAGVDAVTSFLLKKERDILQLEHRGDGGTGLGDYTVCLLYTSPSPRDQRGARMPS